jgi:ferredoxin
MAEQAGFRIWIDGDAAGFPCRADQHVLQAMREAGRPLLAVGCRSGGCGICRIRVTEGQYATRQMSAAAVSCDEAGEGYALACRVLPRSDMRIITAPLCRGMIEKALAA